MKEFNEMKKEELEQVTGGAAAAETPGPKYEAGETVATRYGWEAVVLHADRKASPFSPEDGYYLYTVIIVKLPAGYDGLYRIGENRTVPESDIIPL